MYEKILFEKNDFLDAATQYKRLINMEPGNEELYFKLADTYIYANKLRKAIGVYDDLEQYQWQSFGSKNYEIQMFLLPYSNV